nr:Maf-like protein [uncultured Gellertiella sp.]
MSKPLVLASASPFRRQLMENAGLTFLTESARINERAIEAPLEAAGETPDAVAVALAIAKAVDVSSRYPGAVVIGSDQTLSQGQRVYHKPRDMAEAVEHLRSFSASTHRLNSAMVLVLDGDLLWQHVAHAEMTVRALSDDFITRHLQRVGTRALSSVGAYQLEGEGIHLFERIEGDYFTILGLPMLPLLNKLREMGLIDG